MESTKEQGRVGDEFRRRLGEDPLTAALSYAFPGNSHSGQICARNQAWQKLIGAGWSAREHQGQSVWHSTGGGGVLQEGLLGKGSADACP